MRKASNFVLAGVLASSLLVGCSSHTTKTTRVNDEGQTVTETTEKDTDAGESGGIVSGTVNVIGEILALPFRIVGGLIRLIF
ncbi:MAG: hypothetical protein QOD06_1188 [Candidatus Binatota bacterium]|jgi:hypothetical protein|nr:hypothetical protein [Candidatus Binatota bacterium]